MSYSPALIARVVADRRRHAADLVPLGLVAAYRRAFHIAACRQVAAAAARRRGPVAA